MTKTPEEMAQKKSVSFDDRSVPIGIRKMRFVKWLMSKKGVSLDKAKLICYRKFYREEHR